MKISDVGEAILDAIKEQVPAPVANALITMAVARIVEWANHHFPPTASQQTVLPPDQQV